MENLEIKKIERISDFEKIVDIRISVFQKEQRVSQELDFDDKDGEAEHFLAFYNKKPVACARIVFEDEKAKLERIAVLKEFRGKGIGKELINYLINYCRERKVKEIYFDAQYHAKLFYEKLVFRERGKPFEEVGIKHIQMFMDLT